MNRPGTHDAVDRSFYDAINFYFPISKGILMSARIFFSVIFLASLLTGPASHAEWRSNNTHYQSMHIRQMAKRHFTNRGTVQYIYTDKIEKNADGTQSVGAVSLKKNNRIRQVNIAVDLSRSPLRGSGIGSNRKLSIGSVSGDTKHLKKVNVVIHGRRTIRY